MPIRFTLQFSEIVSTFSSIFFKEHSLLFARLAPLTYLFNQTKCKGISLPMELDVSRQLHRDFRTDLFQLEVELQYRCFINGLLRHSILLCFLLRLHYRHRPKSGALADPNPNLDSQWQLFCYRCTTAGSIRMALKYNFLN